MNNNSTKEMMIVECMLKALVNDIHPISCLQNEVMKMCSTICEETDTYGISVHGGELSKKNNKDPMGVIVTQFCVPMSICNREALLQVTEMTQAYVDAVYKYLELQNLPNDIKPVRSVHSVEDMLNKESQRMI